MKNLVGQKFHSLWVLRLNGEDKFHRKLWLCRCLCGKEKSIRSRHLLSGQIKTCGCGFGIVRPKPALGLKKEKHPRWKGGKFLSEDGYIMQYIGNGKYALSHRLVYEKHFGKIPKNMVVHHKNGNKVDNRIKNLELLNRSDHAKEHEFGSIIENQFPHQNRKHQWQSKG